MKQCNIKHSKIVLIEILVFLGLLEAENFLYSDQRRDFSTLFNQQPQFILIYQRRLVQAFNQPQFQAFRPTAHPRSWLFRERRGPRSRLFSQKPPNSRLLYQQRFTSRLSTNRALNPGCSANSASFPGFSADGAAVPFLKI